MNVYNFQKDQLALKIVLPEKLSSIAVDPKGDYCAGGTSQGRMYFWEIASGVMYNAWDAHYRQVTVLRFTHDGSALLSGSKDSGVSVWSVSRLLDEDLQNELPTPYCSLTDHTLPVTDVVCGVGLFPSCRVLTASADHSVKLWDLSSKSLLTTFDFPQPISCLAWDATERLFLAASADGSIHQVNLFRQRVDEFDHAAVEAVGGAGVTDVIRIDDEDQHTARKRLISVGQPVTTLSLSITSSLLLAGTATGLIHIYDVTSHQLLRTLSTHKGLVITHLATLIRPSDLIGHISLSMAAGGEARDSVPVRTVAPFQRMRDAKAREAHEVGIILPIQSSTKTEAFFECPREELLRDHAFFVQSSITGGGVEPTGVSLQSRVNELEDEVVKLREQLGKAKGVNDVIWETVVRQMIEESKEKEKAKAVSQADAQQNQDVQMEEDSGRRRKRGRT
ncbi:Pre-rRNA-processing protein [Sparassis crispa]|uniref:Pre-rRNA-processing protein IPI3 n=1 Tax=Sparassis crispa TaxID=139825 RepID=A0A401GVW7_9APHY|nr:Pre-rRNA-processing protein [Sparassis crispa]GBE86365.1 Pre-rRNA-processing protein [Sparassis crispa]